MLSSKQSSNLISATWTWALVGCITLIIDYFSFIFTYLILDSVIVSNSIAGFLAISFNYSSHYIWTFKSESNHISSVSRYSLNFLFFWTVGTIVLHSLIAIDLDPKIAKLIPTFLIAPLSYISLKYFVFKK